VKYVLKDPIELENTTITELNLRERICAGDLRDLVVEDLGNTKRETFVRDAIRIAHRISGQPEAVISKLEFFDLMEVYAHFGNFFARTSGQKTGSKSSQ